MKVEILKEAGYEEAILGLSLSKGAKLDRAKEVAVILAPMDLGHNKVLEHIEVWLLVDAPRYWWQEADTYRLSSKQSESTMHTIHKRNLTQEDFESSILPAYLVHLNQLIDIYMKTKTVADLVKLKNAMPEGFLQRREWKMSYKTLRNILLQRTKHRLPQWHMLCDYVRKNIEHPELLPQ